MSLTGKQGKWLYHYLHYEFWKDSKEVLRTVVYLLLLREYGLNAEISSSQIIMTLKDRKTAQISPTDGGFYPNLRALIEDLPEGFVITRSITPALFYVRLKEAALPMPAEKQAEPPAGTDAAAAESAPTQRLLELLWDNCAPGTEQNANIVTRLLMTHGFRPEHYGVNETGLLTALGFSTHMAAGIRLVTIPQRPEPEPVPEEEVPPEQEPPRHVDPESPRPEPAVPVSKGVEEAQTPANENKSNSAEPPHAPAEDKPTPLAAPVYTLPKPTEKLQTAAKGGAPRRAFNAEEQARVLALLRREYAPGSQIPMAKVFHFLDDNGCAANRYELDGAPLKGKMILEILRIPTQKNEQGGWLVCMPENSQKSEKLAEFEDNLSKTDEISFDFAGEPTPAESAPAGETVSDRPKHMPPVNCRNEVFFPYANQDRLAEQLGAPTLNADLMAEVCAAYDAAAAAGQVTWNASRGCFNAVLALTNTAGSPLLLGISRSDQKGGLPFYLSFVGSAPKAARLTALQEFAWLGNYHAFLQQLADLAEPEMWSFQGRDDLSILNNYITYTFARLKQQDKVYTDPEGRFAAFNTGLMSRIYGEDLMAYFVPNNVPDRQAWRFAAFCSTLDEARGDSVQRSAAIALAPVRSKLHLASYFTDVCFETRFDPNCELDYQFFHMIGDNIGRFPLDFLRKHCNDFPRSRALLAKIEAESDPNRQRQLFKELGRAVTDLEDADMSALFYDLRIQFEAAVNHTLEQARRDYKVGIPCFFPTTGKLSMLLPIAFSARRNAKPCLALVVERLDNGMYVGRTVLTMDMAYKDSRLLCRPSGEWLRPADIVSDGEEEE